MVEILATNALIYIALVAVAGVLAGVVIKKVYCRKCVKWLVYL